jgi:hypothetical protein
VRGGTPRFLPGSSIARPDTQRASLMRLPPERARVIKLSPAASRPSGTAGQGDGAALLRGQAGLGAGHELGIVRLKQDFVEARKRMITLPVVRSAPKPEGGLGRQLLALNPGALVQALKTFAVVLGSLVKSGSARQPMARAR